MITLLANHTSISSNLGRITKIITNGILRESTNTSGSSYTLKFLYSSIINTTCGVNVLVFTPQNRLNRRDFILSRRCPSRLRILTAKLFPMIPDNAVRYKKIICVQIHIIHNRRQHSLTTNYLGRYSLKRITRKNFLTKKRNQFASVKTSLNVMRLTKDTPLYFSFRKFLKMRLNISVQ